MRPLFPLLACLCFGYAGVAGAAPNSRASAPRSEIIQSALMCDLSPGRAAAVVKAVREQKAQHGTHENDYLLPVPTQVFGLTVQHINVTPSDGESPDSYAAIFAGAVLADVATAARLKPLAGGFVRDTKHGRLSADVRDRTNVHLTCTSTQ